MVEEASLEVLQRTVLRLQQQNASLLQHGGGGGTSDGMLERVVKLEANVEALQRDVTDLRGDMKDVRDRLGKLEVKVDHLPSKAFVFSVFVVISTLLAAVTLFQAQIQQLLGLTTGS